MFGRKLRTHLDLIHPDLQGRMESKVEKQKDNRDKWRKGDQVFVKNYKLQRVTEMDRRVVYRRVGPLLINFSKLMSIKRTNPWIIYVLSEYNHISDRLTCIPACTSNLDFDTAHPVDR